MSKSKTDVEWIMYRSAQIPAPGQYNFKEITPNGGKFNMVPAPHFRVGLPSAFLFISLSLGCLFSRYPLPLSLSYSHGGFRSLCFAFSLSLSLSVALSFPLARALMHTHPLSCTRKPALALTCVVSLFLSLSLS